MQTVADYLNEYQHLGKKQFLEKFNHPFLLYPDQHGHGGFRSYHTKLADRGAGGNLADSEKSIGEFQVLVPAHGHKTKFLVGRSENRDLFIDHSTVSKRHAFLVWDEESSAYKLGDAGSTNGTMLNGHVVDSGEPVYLRDGNVVSFGDCDYLFFSPKGFADVLKRIK